MTMRGGVHRPSSVLVERLICSVVCLVRGSRESGVGWKQKAEGRWYGTNPVRGVERELRAVVVSCVQYVGVSVLDAWRAHKASTFFIGVTLGERVSSPSNA